MIVTHSSCAVTPPTAATSASRALTFPLLAATTSAASTFWIAIFVSVPIDVEKAIIWASKSGNRVLTEVGQRQALYSAALLVKVLGGNEFRLGRAGGRCWLFCRRSVLCLGCSKAKTTFPTA